MRKRYKTDIVLFSIFLSWIFPAFILFGWGCFLFFLVFFSLYAFSIACNQLKEDIFIGSLSSAFLTACILICTLYAVFYFIADDPKNIIVGYYMKNAKEFIPIIIGAALPISLVLSYIFYQNKPQKTNR